MELRFKILDDTQQLTFPKAVELGTVVIEDNRIYSNHAKILLSTLLFDMDGHEIFEDDTVVDESNHEYKIIYKSGAFFALCCTPGDSRVIPLYLLEGNGYIPVRISKKY